MTKMIDQDTMTQEKPEFVEYPVTMSHPAFSPSKAVPVPGTQRYDTLGRLVYEDTKGTPERLPPVTVLDADQEEYYRAQGYERAGKIDPAAWVRAHADAPGVDYQPQKYPLWRDGVLILTAQEDPDGEPTYEEAVTAKVAVELMQAPAGEAETLRAELDEMNRMMLNMMESMRAKDEENARLKAQAEAVVAPKPRGRPKKAD